MTLSETNFKNDLHESLEYAVSIQQGLLPKDRHFKKLTNDYKLIYIPHSKLSGDFYWIGTKNNNHYLALADCTGHGIPASLLTVMGISLLNYIILGKEFRELGDYLKELDKKWIETFQHELETNFNNDWMEISLINLTNNVIKICGARQKVILFNSETGKIKIIKGEKYPIGGWQLEKNRVFSTTTIPRHFFNECYLFSDGLTDQFGGNNNKKFGLNRLINIIKTKFSSVSEKVEFIEECLLDWKDKNEILDDITLIGISI